MRSTYSPKMKPNTAIIIKDLLHVPKSNCQIEIRKIKTVNKITSSGLDKNSNCRLGNELIYSAKMAASVIDEDFKRTMKERKEYWQGYRLI